MAKNPWVLPDGFDSSVNKGIKELIASLKKSGKAIPQAAYDQLAMGDINAFYRLIDFEGLGDDLDGIKEIIRQQAESSAKQVFTMGGVQAQLAFDLVDARAVEYAAQSSAKLVREITDEMRQNIQQNIARATAGEITFPELVTELQMKLPLTARGSAAVDRFQQSNYERYLRQGLSETKAKRKAFDKATRYRNKLVEDRAKVIARTEVADAAMQGRYLGWESGVQSGIIDNQSVKEWIAEPDACSICLPLDGMIIGWTGDFPIGANGTTGTTDRMPPAHPNCRCSVALLPPDFADSVYTEQSGGEMPPEEKQRMRIPEGIEVDGKADPTLGDSDLKTAVTETYNRHVADNWRKKYGRDLTYEDMLTREYDFEMFAARHDPLLHQKFARMPELTKFLEPLGQAGGIDAYSGSVLAYRQPIGQTLLNMLAPTSKQKNFTLQYPKRLNVAALNEKARALPVLSIKEATDEANEHLAKFINKAEPSIMIDADNLVSVLEDGRFRNAFEDVSYRTENYLLARNFYEAKAFGYGANFDATKRPIYGVMLGKSKYGRDAVSHYGDARVVLKKEVLARSSVTMGDSLNNYRHPVSASNPKLFPDADMDDIASAANYNRLKAPTNYFESMDFEEYVELQVHGGVEVGDIEKVYFSSEPDIFIIDELERLNITWEVE